MRFEQLHMACSKGASCGGGTCNAILQDIEQWMHCHASILRGDRTLRHGAVHAHLRSARRSRTLPTWDLIAACMHKHAQQLKRTDPRVHALGNEPTRFHHIGHMQAVKYRSVLPQHTLPHVSAQKFLSNQSLDRRRC